MKMSLINKTPLRAAIAIIVIAVGATFVAPVEAQVPTQGGLLFSDNFTTSTPGADVNADIYSPTRVSGPLAGTVGYDTTNAVGTVGLDGTRLNIADNARLGLNYNFSGDVARGGMKISYDFQGIVGAGETTDWASLFTGCNSSAIPEFLAIDNWNSWITFSDYPVNNWYSYGCNNGNLQYIDGTTGVPFNDTVHHADIIISDMVDGQPFNGTGVVLYDYYIDGKFIASTWDGADYADMPNNYIGFLMSSATPGGIFNFDNLQIYGNDLLLDTSNQWLYDTPANWTASSSWSLSVPNARGANALIMSGKPTVYVDQDVVIGNLCLNNDYTTISSSSGNKITFWANAGANSRLQVLSLMNDISAPIELKNDLDITVLPNSMLNLSGTMTAPDGPVNVSITPNSGGYPGGSVGIVTISNTFNPGGTFNLFGGTVNVTNGGALTTSSVYLGDHKSWNILQIATGGTLTTDLVAGDGMLQIYGGTFAGATHKPTLDLRALVLGGGSTYTIEQDETITCAEVLGNGDAWSSLTFDGGTMKIRTDPYSPYGANLGTLGYADLTTNLMLGNVYVTDKGANIDLNGNGLVCSNFFEDAPGLPGNAGRVTVSNGNQLNLADNAAFTGGYTFNDVGAVYVGTSTNFGTGTVEVLDGSGVAYEPAAALIDVATNFFLEGPAKTPWYNTLSVDWPGAVNFTGTIDVTDAETYPAGDQRNLTTMGTHSHAIAPPCYMNISGVITGTGGVQFGKAENVGRVANGLVYLSGSQPNTFEGPAVVTCQIVVLQKDPGVVAIPHDLVVAPIVLGAGFMLGADNQTSPTDTVLRFTNALTDRWGDFSLNGHVTTVRGITAPATGLNGIENISIAPNGCGFADFMVAPTTVGTLTVNPQAGDDFNYSGYIADAVHVWAGLDPASVPPVALVKTGEGTQRLAAGAVWQYGYFVFTGGTTVKAGVLDISSVNTVFNDLQPELGFQIGYTPNHSITLEGGTLLASGLLQNTITRGTTTSGTLEAGGTAYPILDVNKAVDIAAAVIDPGHTLSLTSGGTNVIDNITGSAGALVVTGTTMLTTQSINVDTLQIGGVAPVAYVTISVPPTATAVPEPSTLVLLVLASLGAILAYRRK